MQDPAYELLTADFGVIDPHRMMRTDTVRPKNLLDHSYMHGSCGSTSAQSAIERRKSEVQLRRIYVPRLYENSERALSLVRLTRGIDLFIGYVDLRYGSSFEELAHLSQRADRREVAPISLVQPLLMVAALSDGHTLGHDARVEALKELNLEPGGHDPLCKKPL